MEANFLVHVWWQWSLSLGACFLPLLGCLLAVDSIAYQCVKGKKKKRLHNTVMVEVMVAQVNFLTDYKCLHLPDKVFVPGPGPGPRYGHVMVLVGQRYLVAIGGNDGKQPLSDVWA